MPQQDLIDNLGEVLAAQSQLESCEQQQARSFAAFPSAGCPISERNFLWRQTSFLTARLTAEPAEQSFGVNPCAEGFVSALVDGKRLDAVLLHQAFRNCLQGACNFGTLVKSTKERRSSTLWRRRDPQRSEPQRRAGVKASGAREKSLDQNQKRKAGYRSWNSNTIN
jgi:hypothetical protein